MLLLLLFQLSTTAVLNNGPVFEDDWQGVRRVRIPVKGGNGAYFAKSVRHPGTQPVRFMLAAVESIDMSNILDHAIDRAMQKAGL